MVDNPEFEKDDVGRAWGERVADNVGCIVQKNRLVFSLERVALFLVIP